MPSGLQFRKLPAGPCSRGHGGGAVSGVEFVIAPPHPASTFSAPMSRCFYAIPLLALALTGCRVSSPDSRMGEAGVPVPGSWSASREARAGVDTDWVARMGSPRLTALVREAVAHNPDLKIAAARVEQTRSLILSSSAGAKPKVDLEASGFVHVGEEADARPAAAGG